MRRPAKPILVTPSDTERFMKYVWKLESGCWEWTGGKSLGYGTFYVGARKIGDSVRAHRYAYAAFLEQPDPFLHLDHICRKRDCVNPQHLEQVPPHVNVARGISPSAINKRKRKCVRGHLLEGENLIKRAGGERGCRQCQRKANMKHSRKTRGLTIQETIEQCKTSNENASHRQHQAAIEQAREFLISLVDYRETPRVPSAVRLRAYCLLLHYPSRARLVQVEEIKP